MNVLIACEESQTECIAFRKRGHNAFSCDIQNCSGGHPEWHVKGDVLEILNPINGSNGETMGRIPMKDIRVEVSQDGLNWNFVSVVTTLKDYERLKRKLVEEYRLVRLIAVIKTAKKRT